MNERIVCAANRNSIGHIVLGVRHFDAVMHIAIVDYYMAARCSSSFDEQGFFTSQGRFVSRTEAWKIAEAEGQILRRCGGDTANGGTLYSENLY